MDTLERDVRQELDRRVGAPPVRSMPRGTRSRVRGRQARWVAALTVVAVGVSFGGLAVLKSVPRHDGTPADGGTAPAVHDDPLEQVPAGWPAVVIGNPADGYRLPEDVADSVGPVRIIASGTVEDAGFSFQSYVGAGPDEGWLGPCLGFAGPGLDQFASPDPQPPGAVGGVSSQTCAHVQGVPQDADMYLTSQQDPDQAPGISPNYGFLSARVDRLELRLEGGGTFEIPVLASPPGWDGVQPFLFFPPGDRTGTLTAYAADGTELATAPMCFSSVKASYGCGGGGNTTQIAPIPHAS